MGIARQDVRSAALPRRSSRLQNKGNARKPAGHAIPARPYQEPPAARQKRKREPLQDPEHGSEGNSKPSLPERKRRTAPTTNVKHKGERAIQALNESNLLGLEHAVAAAGIEKGPCLPDWVQTTSNATRVKKESGEGSASGLSRGRSRRPWSSVPDLGPGSSSQTSRQSAMAAARYRFHALTSANLFFADEPLPDKLSNKITDILNASVSSKREQELDRVALDIWKGCGPVHAKIPGQDDCLEPLYRALSLMNGHRMLEMPQKAGNVLESYCLLDRVQHRTFHAHIWLRLAPEPEACD